MKKHSLTNTAPFQSSLLRSHTAAGMNFDLSRMERAAACLGDPQNRFPSIHVAGTNGKGSVAKMIATVLEKAGLTVGLYTSPHLVDVRERFQINGDLIHRKQFFRLFDFIRKRLKINKIRIESLTEFEILTLISFVWFAHRKADVAVMEVGLGGRLDATNILTNVLVSVITTIDFDHTQILGRSKKKIAAEKAGIVKSGRPVVTGVSKDVLPVLREIARRHQSRLVWVSPHSFKSKPFVSPQLRGRHQKLNAALAVKVINLLQDKPFRISKWSIIRGIRESRWPGRFEIFRIKNQGRSIKIILDGAHNPAGIQSLVDTLRADGIRHVDLLFGVLKDKDYRGMIRRLATVVRTGVAVPVSSDRTARAMDVARVPIWKNRMVVKRNPQEGLSYLLKLNERERNRLGECLLVTGSLYLVGAVREIVRRMK